MGWTNQTQHSLYIYNTDGSILLSVDSDGFDFVGNGTEVIIDEDGLGVARSPFDGSFIQLSSFSDGTFLYLMPKTSVVPGASFTVPGLMVAQENVITPGVETQGYVNIQSPSVNGKSRGIITITGESNNSVLKPEIQLLAQSLYGINKNMIGAGTVDTYPGLFSTNFTGTRTIFDYCRPNGVGVMSTTRSYEVEFNFSIISTGTASSNFANLQIYASPSPTSLSGATLLYDAGTFDGSFQQMSLNWVFNGLPGSYIVLTGQRTSGTGTFTGYGNYRKLSDVVNAF